VIDLLELQSGRDEVLAPAYICGEALLPFEARGITVRYYDLESGFRAGETAILENLTPAVRLLVAVHYFGFPQPAIRGLCTLAASRGVALLEDCALAYGSRVDGRLLGTFGDFGLFSLWKFLPLPAGGMLVARENRTGASPRPQANDRRAWRFLANSLWNGWERDLGFSVKRLVKRCARTSRAGPSGQACCPENNSWEKGPYNATLRIMGRLEPWRDIEHRRRSNYQQLLEGVAGITGSEAAFPDIPEGVCPWAFPILTGDRPYVAAALTRQGIPHHPWPDEIDLPPGVRENLAHYPVTTGYVRELLLLPIHQDLGPQQVSFIIQALKTL
jgi:dTDP-4-amino-4,6-dideoxygalactose transaminase